MRIFRRIRREIIRAGHQPERTAVAVALGVWLAFSPFVGLHLISGFFLARAFRLNTMVVLTVAMLHNPWTMIAIHFAGLAVGDLVLYGNLASLDSFRAFPWNQLGFANLFDAGFWSVNGPNLWNILIPFTAGSLLLSTAFGGLAYALSVRFMRRRRARKAAAPA